MPAEEKPRDEVKGESKEERKAPPAPAKEAAAPEKSEKPSQAQVQRQAASALFSKAGQKRGEQDRKPRQEPQEFSEEALDNWNISLMLDNYEDIFSDFDARHFSERALSYDFLEECKRAVRSKVAKGLEVRMMVPAKERDAISEGLIRQRLRKNFQKNYKEKLAERERAKREGLSFVAIGMLFLVLGGLVMSSEMSGFLVNLLLVVLEPAGWFLAWTGLDTIRNLNRNFPDVEFYRKLSSAEFLFFSY